MLHERQAQLAHRIQQVQAMRTRFAESGQYQRAYKAHLLVNRVYDRWADEVFAAARTN
jgi:hypothetical protein